MTNRDYDAINRRPLSRCQRNRRLGAARPLAISILVVALAAGGIIAAFVLSRDKAVVSPPPASTDHPASASETTPQPAVQATPSQPAQSAAPPASAPVAPPAPAPAPQALPTGVAPTPPANAKLFPVDQAKRDSSLVAFRNRLLQAAEKQDKEALLAALAPDVKVSFGGAAGVEAFKSAWNLDGPDSRVWTELQGALKRGGTFIDEGGNTGALFVAPFVYGNWPKQFDPAQFALILGEKVNVRQAPDSKAPAVGQLTYDIVGRISESNPPTETIGGETYPWVKVTLSNGSQGYVFGKYVRGPMDYRVGLRKIDGEWKIAFFVSGD